MNENDDDIIDSDREMRIKQDEAAQRREEELMSAPPQPAPTEVPQQDIFVQRGGLDLTSEQIADLRKTGLTMYHADCGSCVEDMVKEVIRTAGRAVVDLILPPPAGSCDGDHGTPFRPPEHAIKAAHDQQDAVHDAVKGILEFATEGIDDPEVREAIKTTERAELLGWVKKWCAAGVRAMRNPDSGTNQDRAIEARAERDAGFRDYCEAADGGAPKAELQSRADWEFSRMAKALKVIADTPDSGLARERVRAWLDAEISKALNAPDEHNPVWLGHLMDSFRAHFGCERCDGSGRAGFVVVADENVGWARCVVCNEREDTP